MRRNTDRMQGKSCSSRLFGAVIISFRVIVILLELPRRRMGANLSPPSRIVSLDQFRGYTVLGMLFVNFVGHSFRAIPAVFQHHNTYCSYADTIMPQFFFAVGFAYRLTLLRRLEKEGGWSSYAHAVRRNLGLILLGLMIYHLDGRVESWQSLTALGLWGILTTAFQRAPFQTLVHIGITALWIMPVIAARPAVRIVFLVGSGLLHLALSYSFYYQWASQHVIDGGPLGFLTWTVPMLVGSLAYDTMAQRSKSAAVVRFLGWGAILMLLGYAISCLTVGTAAALHGPSFLLVEPPFVPPTRAPNLWIMSQKAGSISYLTFATGFSLALYAFFVWACDIGRLQLGILRTFGVNALAVYILHYMISATLKPYVPGDAPLWYVLTAFGLFLLICYVFAHHLERNKLFLRL
jgi:predicted acyltransferase